MQESARGAAAPPEDAADDAARIEKSEELACTPGVDPNRAVGATFEATPLAKRRRRHTLALDKTNLADVVREARRLVRVQGDDAVFLVLRAVEARQRHPFLWHRFDLNREEGDVPWHPCANLACCSLAYESDSEFETDE